jgi:hypothetical protein
MQHILNHLMHRDFFESNRDFLHSQDDVDFSFFDEVDDNIDALDMYNSGSSS